MSLRALRVFDAKMAEHEAALSESLTSALTPIPIPARPMITASMREAFDDLQQELEWRGDLFLSQARSEGYKLLDRDLTGLRAGGLDTRQVQIEPAVFGLSMMKEWREYLVGVVGKAVDETERQGRLAWQYDSPAREGWDRRVNSPEPCRVIGHPGKGVVQILPAICTGHLTDLAFGAVNRMRVETVSTL